MVVRLIGIHFLIAVWLAGALPAADNADMSKMSAAEIRHLLTKDAIRVAVILPDVLDIQTVERLYLSELQAQLSFPDPIITIHAQATEPHLKVVHNFTVIGSYVGSLGAIGKLLPRPDKNKQPLSFQLQVNGRPVTAWSDVTTDMLQALAEQGIILQPHLFYRER